MVGGSEGGLEADRAVSEVGGWVKIVGLANSELAAM